MVENDAEFRTYSWAEFGYRQLGSTATGAGVEEEVLKTIERIGGYDVQKPNWIRHSARARGKITPCIEAIATVTSDTAIDRSSLAFVDEYFNWYSNYVDRMTPSFPTIYSPESELLAVAAEARTTKQPWTFIKYLASISAFARTSSLLKEMLASHVFPMFFERYPRGTVLVLRHRYPHEGLTATIRSLYTATQMPKDAWLAAGVRGFDTMRYFHSVQTTELAFELIHVANYLWYPHVAGFMGGPAGLQFLFLFDPPEKYKPMPFPTDWLAIPQLQAGYGGERADEIAAIRSLDNPDHIKLAHRRLLNESYPGRAEHLQFLPWFLDAINLFVYSVADVANFTQDNNREGKIDPVFAFEHLLTIHRILKRTLAVMSLKEVASAKSAVFEIADLFGTLSQRFRNSSSDVEFSKSLFNPMAALRLIEPRLAAIPGLGDKLVALARRAYKDLEDTVLASVWIKSKVRSDGILVRDKHLTGEIVEPSSEFVANVMRAYRNGHHGYFTDGDIKQRPSRYLWLVDGNVPDSITTLPALWVLAYLSDPSLVGWTPIPVGDPSWIV